MGGPPRVNEMIEGGVRLSVALRAASSPRRSSPRRSKRATLPFAGIGKLRAEGDGYAWVPVSHIFGR